MQTAYSILPVTCILSCGFLFHFLNTAHSEPELSSLKSLRWDHRLIIGVLPDEKSASDFHAGIEAHMPAIRERKLAILVWVDGEKKERWILSQLKTDNAHTTDLRREIVAKLQGKPIALIGLDGGVKSRYELKTFSWEKVFAEIDSMPMRQQELREE
jgi:hypothetical protein